MPNKKLTTHTLEITKQAGLYLRSEFKNFNQNAIVVKSPNQLVSYVDISAEKMLVEGLSKVLPEAGFITEENTISKLSDKLNWIIDPLDGTTNFMHGIPAFAVSVALYDNNKPILGIIYDVCNDNLFYADQNGAYCNGDNIKVSTNENLSKSLLATGFPYYDFDGIENYLNALKSLMKQTRGLRRMGSAAIDLAYVACGKFEGFFEFGLNSWDVAAGAFIVKKAGGKVSDFDGGENWLFGKTIIATNNIIYNNYFDIINSNFNKK
ncbi:MAG: inositol monophosphatase [Bacteroidia bacterium]|nr:inositol monophosphatase [Bacteroidia bacterium]